MMIRTQTVRFSPDRTPMPKKLKIGYEGDHLVERVAFVLPEIAQEQSAFLMMNGASADIVRLTEDGERYYVDLTAELVGGEGEIECYVRIEGADGTAWSSGEMRLLAGDLPEVEIAVERQYPTAVSQMLQEMAEHEAKMDESETAVQSAAKTAQASAAAAKAAATEAEESAEIMLAEARRYTDSAIAAIPTPDVSGEIGLHNADGSAHPALRAAFQSKLTGMQGQVVGFDENGDAVAQEAAGGAASWNELQDRPFYETRHEGYLLPEVQMGTETESNGDIMFGAPYPGIVPTAGEVYTVYYNGTEYQCEARSAPLILGNEVLLGNGALWAMPDYETEDPFGLLFVPLETIAVMYTSDGATEAVCSVRGPIVEITKLPEQYYEKCTTFYIKLGLEDNYLYRDAIATEKATKEDVRRAMLNGSIVLSMANYAFMSMAYVDLVSHDYARVGAVNKMDSGSGNVLIGIELYTAEYVSKTTE